MYTNGGDDIDGGGSRSRRCNNCSANGRSDEKTVIFNFIRVLGGSEVCTVCCCDELASENEINFHVMQKNAHLKVVLVRSLH